MTNFNSYWPIYKNLEEETLMLTKYIQFSEDQLNVYSMYIADLIIRIVVEIEALSKELYKIHGGPDVFDDNGNIRNLFFDTDCIEYLNNKWGICNRDIIISCTKFNFIDEKYKIFKPLKKSNKRGDKSSKWNKAYQAVKHDRRNNLKKGNIENLIQALGALYILNIYYRDDIIEYGTELTPNNLFDNRLGSEIFAATFADASKTSISEDDSDNAIKKEERVKLDSALCIIKYSDEAWEKMHTAMSDYNKEMINGLIKDPEFIKKLNERIVNFNDNNEITRITHELMEEMKVDYVRKHPPMSCGSVILRGKKEIILNKGQTIYKT